jgi:uncharacterized protein RhaS with RHS repeats
VRARCYDPVTGRFLQVDPIGVWGDAANRGNGYGYVGNIVVNAIDPNGMYGMLVFQYSIVALMEIQCKIFICCRDAESMPIIPPSWAGAQHCYFVIREWPERYASIAMVPTGNLAQYEIVENDVNNPVDGNEVGNGNAPCPKGFTRFRVTCSYPCLSFAAMIRETIGNRGTWLPSSTCNHWVDALLRKGRDLGCRTDWTRSWAEGPGVRVLRGLGFEPIRPWWDSIAPQY